MRAIKKLTPRWYTPAAEKDQANPVRFRLQPITALQAYEIGTGIARNYDGDLIYSPAAIRAAWQYGVIEVENLDGYDPTQPIIDQIPPGAHLAEVALEVMASSTVGGQEKNESGPPLKSAETPGNSSAGDASGGDIAATDGQATTAPQVSTSG